jgi:hypothetical protein
MNTEILVSVVEIELRAVPPYMLQSCVLVPPTPVPEPEPENVVSTPVPPGIEYETLPVIDPVTQIIDTSPDQIIGCANSLLTSREQQTLDSLFPEAVSGDGVVNRSNNDIWTYNGSVWTNVGPTPGRQLVTVPSLPPWNEIVVLLGLVKAKISIQSLNYALEVTTEAGTIAVKTKAAIKSVRIIEPASIGLQLDVLPPGVEMVQRAFGKVAEVISYTGTASGSTRLATRWPASMILLCPTEVGNWLWSDITRGANAWVPNSFYTLNLEPSDSLVFEEDAITVQGGTFNTDSAPYRVYIFKGKQESIENNAGSIPVNIYESDAFNILTYEGTGLSGTIGHGLGEIPSLLIFKTGDKFGVAGGSFIGVDYYVPLESPEPRIGSYEYIKGLTSDTISIGPGQKINTNGITSTCYAFKQKENYCKIGTYYGNNLAAGKSIDCGFNIGLVLVKNLTQDGKWFLLYEKDEDQGLRIPSWDEIADFVNTEPVYSFTGNNFTVYGNLQATLDVNSLNLLGSEYLYVALAFSITNRLFCPPAGVSMQALGPAISCGVSVGITIKGLVFTALVPPYIGTRVALVVTRTAGIEFQPHKPIISTSVNILLPVTAIEFSAHAVAYVGEVAEDGYSYIAIVEDLDGEPLEASVRGCAYSLIKDLKDAGLWSKFLTIVPTCMSRTLRGALVPLTGIFPIVSSAALSGLSYSRRSGIRQILASGSFFTGVTNNLIPATDNHLAVYLSQINDDSAGAALGRLIGDGYITNAVNIARPTTSAELTFETRNKDATTELSTAPAWSQPSLVGIAREDSSDYTLRLASVDRSISSDTIDQSAFLIFTNITLFASSGAASTFRVPLYSIGRALDMGVLEGVVETFLDRLDLIGGLSTKIFPPSTGFQVEAKAPATVG